MPDVTFKYMGKAVVIRENHPDAVVSVDGRQYACHHHHAKDGKGLSMWMCNEAYFASPDIKDLARHFADYGYMFDDPDRCVVNEDGKLVPNKKGGNSAGGHEGHGAGTGGR